MLQLLNTAATASGIYSFWTKEQENQLLDPLCSSIALALIHFCPDGTKLGFHDHEITIVFPGPTQGVSRKYKREGCRDLTQLRPAIEMVTEWYHPSRLSYEKCQQISTLFEWAMQGADRLIDSLKDRKEDDARIAVSDLRLAKKALRKSLKEHRLAMDTFKSQQSDQADSLANQLLTPAKWKEEGFSDGFNKAITNGADLHLILTRAVEIAVEKSKAKSGDARNKAKEEEPVDQPVLVPKREQKLPDPKSPIDFTKDWMPGEYDLIHDQLIWLSQNVEQAAAKEMKITLIESCQKIMKTVSERLRKALNPS